MTANPKIDPVAARKLTREERNALFEKEVVDWKTSEVLAVLRERHAPTVVPPCRLCGAKLSCQSMGGGEPIVYACDGHVEPGSRDYVPGRGFADTHYSESRWFDRRHADETVVELARRADLAITILREWRAMPDDVRTEMDRTNSTAAFCRWFGALEKRADALLAIGGAP